MLNVIEVKFPGAMDHLPVFFDLLRSQRRAAFRETMRRDRHDVRRSVGKPDAGAGKRNLHHVFRKVASRMKHVLVRGRDVAAGRVVVSSEVRRNATPFTRSKQQRKIDLST